MCKLSYILYEGYECECKHIVDEPQYCSGVKPKGTFFKKPIELPAWIPTLSVTNSGLGAFDLVMNDGLRYQEQKYFEPVDCEHIEYLKQDTKDSCPYHKNHDMQMAICETIVHTRGEAPEAREHRWSRWGRNAKKVRNAILFDEPIKGWMAGL